uniref:Cystatin n=1 Tax=Pseudonaja textilis TaxID=8673 RepID=A0A670Y2P5_PSETE
MDPATLSLLPSETDSCHSSLLFIALLKIGGREGRQRLLGGRENASPEEPGVQAALQFAMNEYNRGSNDMYASRVSEVVEAQKQIVAGVKYFFTVRIGRTVCRKGASDLENCAFHDTPKLAQVIHFCMTPGFVPLINSLALITDLLCSTMGDAKNKALGSLHNAILGSVTSL